VYVCRFTTKAAKNGGGGGQTPNFLPSSRKLSSIAAKIFFLLPSHSFFWVLTVLPFLTLP
jgi:hypothetical protein